MPPKYFSAAIGKSRAEHLPRRLLQGRRIKVRWGEINHRNTAAWRKPRMRHIDHARPRLCGELTQYEWHHNEPSRCAFGARVDCTGMQMRGQAVRDQSPTCALKAILTCVIGTRVATRREQHCPEPDPGAELNDSPFIWECVKPEHRAIEFALPRCATKWSAIVRRTIQVPRLKFVGMLRWRQESESRWHTTLANLRCASSNGCRRRWCKWNADRWLRTFGATAQALF